MFDTIVCFSPVLRLCLFQLQEINFEIKIFNCKKKISILIGKIFVFYRKNICPLREKYLSNLHLSFFRRQLLDDVVKLCINARSERKKTINYKMFFYHLMDWLSNDVNDNGEKERLNRVEIKYQQVVSVQLASFLQNLNDAYKSPSTTALHCIKVPKSSCNVKCFLYLCSFLVLKIQHLFVCNLRRSNRKCAEKCKSKTLC